MTTDHSIPPLRDLPTGRLAERKQHLRTEISEREPRFLLSAFILPPFILPRRRLVAVAIAGAACVAAVAVAASGGWLFSSHDQTIVGVTHVTLQGRSWRVTVNQHTNHGVSFIDVLVSSGHTTSKSRHPGGATSLRSEGPPFTAGRADVRGGQIWAGTTRSSIRRVSITDYAGHVYTTNTIAAPHATKTPYRYWALAVSGEAPAASLTTHDVNGQSILWRLHGQG